MHIIFPILLALAAGTSAQAINLSVTSSITAVSSGGSLFHGALGTQVTMLSSSGSVLPAGSQVRVGFFLNYTPALDSTLKSGNLTSLLTGANRFVPFGESTSPTGYGNNTETTNDLKDLSGIRANVTYTGLTYIGSDNDLTAANTSTSGGVARGTKVFLFLYNAQSLDTSGAGFEFGLYSASSWSIPATGTAATSIQLQLVDTNTEVYWGQLGSLHTAAPVPEPTGTLLALGTLALATVRRRR